MVRKPLHSLFLSPCTPPKTPHRELAFAFHSFDFPSGAPSFALWCCVIGFRSGHAVPKVLVLFVFVLQSVFSELCSHGALLLHGSVFIEPQTATLVTTPCIGSTFGVGHPFCPVRNLPLRQVAQRESRNNPTSLLNAAVFQAARFQRLSFYTYT